jgi:hypothetical protein
LYELRSAPGFDLLAQHWAGSLEDWDDLWFNFDLRLVNDPNLGQLVGGTSLWALPLNTEPPLTVYYHINEDDQIITLHTIAEV